MSGICARGLENFFVSSVFFNNCIKIVTFFSRSLIVACLGKYMLLLYVKYVTE